MSKFMEHLLALRLTLPTSDYSSNEYVGRTPPGSNYRAMFLNRVVVGNAYIVNQQQESLKGPPKGFDSVSHEGTCHESLS